MRLILTKVIRNQNKIGDYITMVSDNTGGNVAYSATFNFNAACAGNMKKTSNYVAGIFIGW